MKEPTLPKGITRKENGDYLIGYKDASGRHHHETAYTLAAAEALFVQRQMEKLQARLPRHGSKSLTLMDDLLNDADEYSYRNNDRASAYDLRIKLEKIRVDFSDHIASRITRADIGDWLDKQESLFKWRPATRNRYQSAWSLIFRVAMENGKVTSNPVVGMKSRREDNQRLRYMSREEEERFVAVLKKDAPHYLPMFILSLHTGMRLSEQLRARVGDYDPNTGLLSVRQRKNRRGPATRYVPMTPPAVEAYEAMCSGREVGQPLCLNARGTAVKTLRAWFDPSLVKAGISNYTWHSNRHSYVSRLVMAGVPLAAVAMYAGHSSVQITMRYSHLFPDTNRLAVDRMMSWYTKPKEALAECAAV